MFWIFAGSLLISVSLAYAWWTKVRVVCLRQDIFDIRDELFDAAIELDAFDDPVYRQTRDHFNHVASSAHLMTIPFVVNAVSHTDTRGKLAKSSNSQLQEVIDECIVRCARRIWRYLLFQTATGWFSLILLAASKLKNIGEQKAVRAIEGWLNSSSAEELYAARKAYHDSKLGGMQAM